MRRPYRKLSSPPSLLCCSHQLGAEAIADATVMTPPASALPVVHNPSRKENKQSNKSKSPRHIKSKGKNKKTEKTRKYYYPRKTPTRLHSPILCIQTRNCIGSMTGYVVSGYQRSISDHRRIRPTVRSPSSRLASTSVTIVVDVDVDRVVKVAAVFLRFFLSQSIPSNNCQGVSIRTVSQSHHKSGLSYPQMLGQC